MKKILFILFIWSFMCMNVNASTHDVEAKYETKYNVNLTTATISKETKNIKLDNYTIALSTNLRDIDIVIIKVEGDANNYVKTITDNNDNYYIGLYQNGKKITESNLDITIK